MFSSKYHQPSYPVSSPPPFFVIRPPIRSPPFGSQGFSSHTAVPFVRQPNFFATSYFSCLRGHFLKIHLIFIHKNTFPSGGTQSMSIFWKSSGIVFLRSALLPHPTIKLFRQLLRIILFPPNHPTYLSWKNFFPDRSENPVRQLRLMAAPIDVTLIPPTKSGQRQ